MKIEHTAVADVVEKVGAGIVRIDAGHRYSGSGTVWSKDVIVTAHHVIEREEGIEIGTGSGSVKATLVGADPGTGIAVLKPETELAPLTLRGSTGLRVGDFVVAVARPGKTVRASFGIVGTFGEDFRTPMGGHVERYLEPNLELPAGYSGGALVDLEGNVIGMNSRGVLRRVHLTLPRETVDRVVSEIQNHGKVRRGHLGVGVHAVKLSPAIATASGQETGVLVHAIEPGSHAEKAGVLQGDVILAIDGRKVGSPWELATALGTRVDAEVVLKVSRAGSVIDVRCRT